MIRDSIVPFPCLRDGCAGTAEIARVLCLLHIAVAEIESAMALTQTDLVQVGP